jgi:hypothetical protein
MQHDHEDDAADASGLTALKLSLVGGFAGTVAGLKRRGVSGAVVGGLLGGTAGYVAGSALDDGAPVDEWEDPIADVRDEPVTVDVGESDEDDTGFDFDSGGDDEGGEDEGDDEDDEESEADEATDEETEEEEVADAGEDADGAEAEDEEGEDEDADDEEEAEE